MIKEVLKTIAETGKEIAETSKNAAKSFDPDKRVETRADSRGVKHADSRFNPDKRVESRTDARHEKLADAKFDPDKRLKPSIVEVSIEKLIKNYIKEMIQNSEFPETIRKIQLDIKDIKRPSSEELREKKKEFTRKKDTLIKQWEVANGKEWPRYKEDVYDKNGNKIRKAGDRYDAHHIHPLSWGGKNVASNITPLRAEVHYDHCGVHRFGGPFDQVSKKIKEA